MKKEFYTEKGGLSMTSAQYLSNLAQEKAKECKETHKFLRFYNTKIKVLGGGSGEGSMMSIGMNQEGVEDLVKGIDTVVEMDSFTAYMREAIKDKNETLDELKHMTLSEWIKFTKHDPLPEAVGYIDWLGKNNLKEVEPDVESPCSPEEEEDDIKVLAGKMDIVSYQNYLRLEAEAAVLGKLCHDKMAPFVIARTAYYDKVKNPLSKEGDGRDTCIYEYAPSIDKDTLESTFESLQKRYREVEAKINKIRFDLREKENTRFLEESKNYREKLAEYKDSCRKANDYNIRLKEKYSQYKEEIETERREIRAEFETWRSEERTRVSKLKIVVPEALQSTYQYLESLGKKSNDQ